MKICKTIVLFLLRVSNIMQSIEKVKKSTAEDKQKDIKINLNLNLT